MGSISIRCNLKSCWYVSCWWCLGLNTMGDKWYGNFLGGVH